MLSIGIVALHLHGITRNFEHRHGERIVRAIVILIIPGKTGIHIGEVQCLLLENSLAGLCNVDLVALCQIHAAATQIIIPTIGMIVSIQEDDVQAGCTRLIQHIKDVIGVFAVAVITGTHGIMQRQMGKHEDGLLISNINLRVQICIQSRCCAFDDVFVFIAPHIVIFIDDKHAVLGRIMGAAGSQSACSRSIMVALYKHHTVICQGAICAGYCIL